MTNFSQEAFDAIQRAELMLRQAADYGLTAKYLDGNASPNGLAAREISNQLKTLLADLKVEQEPKVHKVKSWSTFFSDILTGERTSDIRLNDRRYAVGDKMLLQEFDPVKMTYTGREQLVTITYMQQNKSNPCAISRDALKDGYVVLSIKLEQERKA